MAADGIGNVRLGTRRGGQRTLSTPPWRAPVVRVRASTAEDEAAARALAARLSLDIAPRPTPGDDAAPWTLLVDGHRRMLARPDGVRLELDFVGGRTAARQQEAGLARQPLARALGVTRLRRRLHRLPTVVDATGGLGRDAWFAAALGCPVTVIERSPIVHALLESALDVAARTPATAQTAARLTLLLGEASQRLDRLGARFADVIYLDPMYPPVRRRAAVGKGMQFLHDLLGPAETSASLLDAALATAGCQVTVKRPSGAPSLDGGATFAGQRTTIASPGTRYDLYLHLDPIAGTR